MNNNMPINPPFKDVRITLEINGVIAEQTYWKEVSSERYGEIIALLEKFDDEDEGRTEEN